MYFPFQAILSRFTSKKKSKKAPDGAESNAASDEDHADESDTDARAYAATARELADLADGRLEGEDEDDNDNDDDDDVDVDREAADAALIAAIAAEEDDDMDAVIPMTQENIKTGLLAVEKVRVVLESVSSCSHAL